jgi:adenylosuccinate synthase
MPIKTGKLDVLVGGGLGSEGKGVISAFVANDYDYHVRVGGPNAGHSFKLEQSGEWLTFKMQSIPCGWINPVAKLMIGAGGLVDPDQLFKEIEIIERYDPAIRQRIHIDPNATVLDERARAEEGGIDGTIHKDIGSTGEGVGAARRRRMARDPEGKRSDANKVNLARDVPELTPMLALRPVADILHDALVSGKNVLIEGTQGSGLSLTHGPWPFVTSADTNTSQLLADVGLPPRWVDDIILVIRTHPIRVAGNSGPLKNEITWDEISARLGRDTIERTTVTKKVRRIGEWDEELFLKAVRLNAPTQIALTFVDYLNPKDEGIDDYNQLSAESQTFIQHIEDAADCPVTFVGTGGEGWTLIDRRLNVSSFAMS